MKFIETLVLILGIGGCALVIIITNQEKRAILKDYNKEYKDTPLYYKKYIETSVVYKKNHKH